MNGLERVQATLAGAPTDRRAVSLTACLYGAGLTRCPLGEYYADPAAYARGQAAVREATGTDVLHAPFSVPLEGAAFGAEPRFFDDQPPNLARPAAGSTEEAAALDLPDVDGHPRLLYFRESLRRMVAEHGTQVAVCAACASPVDLPVMLLGIDAWLETILCDEPAARRILDLTCRHFVRWADALLSDGAALLIVPIAFANPLLVPDAFAETVALPALRAAFAQVRGVIAVHSAGTRLLPALGRLAHLPNVRGFIVGTGERFADVRRSVDRCATLTGNIDGPCLGATSAAEVEAACLDLLRERVDDPHFILGTSAADIAIDAPLDNLRALGRAAERFAAGGGCA